MRARNREINIFNMSLLDILTGMLGAFLFLMLGLLPYYSKVSKNNVDPAQVKALQDKIAAQDQQIADLQKQLDDLQKMLAKSGGGGLTADQVQQLMDQLTQLRQQLQDAQNKAAQAEQARQAAVTAQQQAQQQLDDTTKDRDFWKSQQGTVSIICTWDSADADIDILCMGPDGTVYSANQNDKFMGKACVFDGQGSHYGNYKANQMGLFAYLAKPGDYLVFYRVTPGAPPASYANLIANYMYSEVEGKDKGVSIQESGLGPSYSANARPGVYYAWAAMTYDPTNFTLTVKDASKAKWPRGIVMPSASPSVPPPPTQ